MAATEIRIARSDRCENSQRQQFRGPLKTAEREQAVRRYAAQGIETLWCDASHCTPSDRAAIAVVRARDDAVLLTKTMRGKSSTRAEVAAVLEAFACAQRELARATVDEVIVFSDCISQMEPPEGVVLVLRSRKYNLAHRAAKRALDRLRQKR